MLSNTITATRRHEERGKTNTRTQFLTLSFQPVRASLCIFTSLYLSKSSNVSVKTEEPLSVHSCSIFPHIIYADFVNLRCIHERRGQARLWRSSSVWGPGLPLWGLLPGLWQLHASGHAAGRHHLATPPSKHAKRKCCRKFLLGHWLGVVGTSCHAGLYICGLVAFGLLTCAASDKTREFPLSSDWPDYEGWSNTLLCVSLSAVCILCGFWVYIVYFMLNTLFAYSWPREINFSSPPGLWKIKVDVYVK